MHLIDAKLIREYFLFIFIGVSRGAKGEYFIGNYFIDVPVLCFLVEFVLLDGEALQAKPFKIYCFPQPLQATEDRNLEVVVQVRSIPEAHNFEFGEGLECLLRRLPQGYHGVCAHQQNRV